MTTTNHTKNDQNGSLDGQSKATRIPLSPAYKRQRRAAQTVFRRWLKQVERWEKNPRYLGVTFPGITNGDRLAEELVQFARDVVAGRR